MQSNTTIKKEFIIFFLYFLALITLLIVTHHTFLGVQDEAQLYATLKANEPINYMTSYPFALLGGYLYAHFPSIQWYSILMTLYIVLLTALFSWYLAIIRVHTRLNILIKFLLFGIFNLMTLHMLFEVDVTTPTLLLIVMAIPFIRYHQAYFWFIVWIATFLRSQIIISLFPLLIIAYFTMIVKVKPKRNEILLSTLFIILALSTHFSYKLNPTYDKWMEFTEKRAYFTDFGGSPTKDILTSDEYHLARTWWIIDQDLYPYKKVMADAGTTLDIIKQRFSHTHPITHIRYTFEEHKSLYFLFLFSLIVSLYYKSFLKFFGYFTFGGVVVLLFIVKDVDRVTMPILLMWWSMIITDLWYIKHKKYFLLQKALLLGTLTWILYFLYNDIPWERIKSYKSREAMAQELHTLLNKNKMQLEITTGFTSSWEYLIETIMENHLFDEKQWIDYNDDLLLQGWFSRVPLVYKQHNISFNGIHRKYQHYNDWLLAPKSGFLGSTGETHHIRPFLRENLMKFYDQKFPKRGCHHSVVIVDRSKHFIIHKVIELCQNTHRKPIIDLLKRSPKINYVNMEIKGNHLKAFNDDPQLILNLDKKVSDYAEVRVDIESNRNCFLKIFYLNRYIKNYNEENSIRRWIHKGVNSISVVIPGEFLQYPLRIDLVDKKGEYTLKSLKIYHYKIPQ